jgi:hypothetical protein
MADADHRAEHLDDHRAEHLDEIEVALRARG